MSDAETLVDASLPVLDAEPCSPHLVDYAHPDLRREDDRRTAVSAVAEFILGMIGPIALWSIGLAMVGRFALGTGAVVGLLFLAPILMLGFRSTRLIACGWLATLATELIVWLILVRSIQLP